VTATLLLSLLLVASPPAPAGPPALHAQERPGRADTLAPAGEPTWTDDELAAIANLSAWLADPVQFYRDVFDPENKEPLDGWQEDALRACAREKRVAMKACKGPGKTRVLAIYGWWALGLHDNANGFALSITAANLKANLWKEMGLLQARPSAEWLQREFEISGDRIYHRSAPLTWWLMARSFPADADAQQQANTLAGLHAQFVFVLADESSDYPDGVIAAAEGIFANEGVGGAEAHLVQAGNCTRSSGPLFNACTKERARWYVVEITGDPDDPKRSPRISLDYAREMIATWGRDNPWVMTNLLGQFPPTSSDKLLGPNDITAAEARYCAAAEYLGEPVIYGLDVARFGDNKSHLRKRWGPVLFRGYDFRNLDGPQLASQVSAILKRNEKKDGRRPDALFVDVTGGVGASAYDSLKLLGWADIVFPVEFAGAADEPRFLNKRAEIWFRACEWTKKYGCWPSQSNELGRDLTGPTFEYRAVGRRTVFVLESKEKMAERGLPSPDEGDAFALTFTSTTVIAKARQQELADAQAPSAGRSQDWDPYAEGRS
jgi:hypothetical protein